ncbi:hypothetical protein D3C76_1106640 [compost metagenome]
MQQASGPVNQGLIVGGQQYDGQTTVLGVVHQETDGILLRQTEIADQQSHIPLFQHLQATLAVLHPVAGQSQRLDLLLDAGSLEGMILEQQDLELGEPIPPPLLPSLHPLKPGIRQAIDPHPWGLQPRQIVGSRMGGGIEQGDGPGGEQPLPLPARVRPGTVQTGIGRQARLLCRLMGDGVQGIDADGVKYWLLADI